MSFHANGGGPPGGTGLTPPRASEFGSVRTGKVLERIKKLSYSATVNKLLLDVEAAQTEGDVKTDTVGDITIQNTGETPAYAILAYRLWSAAVTDGSAEYHVNHLLKPGEELFIPNSPAVISDAGIEQLTGTVVTDAVPTATANYMYSDSGTTLGEDIAADETEIDVADGDYFRVNDLIQVGINTTTVTKIEVMRVTGISSNTLTVTRALYGTTQSVSGSQTNATSGAVNGAKVYFPYFNIYGNEYNRYTVAQTDASGKFHAMNLFGKGRAATHLMGITPGSFSAKFYNPGYQNLTNDGNITSSTNSGLVASRTYYLSVSIDGGTTDKVTFTVDSNSTKFGGTNGIISKLQSMINALYYDESVNNYEKKASVGIVNGDVRITSGQNLSTSAISVTTNTDGTSAAHTSSGNELFDGSNIMGRLPADIPTAIAAKLPDDTIYDPVTYGASPNTNAFMYDDGNGRLFGAAGNIGSLNYETGEIDFTSKANAEFVFSCLHTSCFSGKQDATDAAKMNTLKFIYGNVPNQKLNGELTITRR